MADVMDAPLGLRSFYSARQRWVSRIPGMSEDVPLELDALGRTSLADVRGTDYWLNYIPIIRARQEKMSEVDMLLSEHNFGIDRPSSTWDGVVLSATQYNRFKRMYGQEVLLDGKNLEAALIADIHQARVDSMEKYGQLRVGEVQKSINATVSEYRDVARKRMIGEWNNDLQMFTSDTPVEYPELQVSIMNNRIQTSVKGK